MMATVAARGTIWTVPQAGDERLCLVLSDPRGVAKGRVEFQVVPIYAPDTLVHIHSASDFLIGAAESSLGFALLAALWNLRPLAATDLGQQVGRVDLRVVTELRDALLHLADPHIRLPQGRVGKEIPSQGALIWRDQEKIAWQQLSGKVLAYLAENPTTFRLDWNVISTFDAESLEQMGRHMAATDDLLGSVTLEALGTSKVCFVVVVPASGLGPAAATNLDAFEQNPTDYRSAGFRTALEPGLPARASTDRTLAGAA
jgi:hypothetical protein